MNKNTNYAKLEYEHDEPPVYEDTKIPMVPESAHSRFEQDMFPTTIEYERRFRSGEITPAPIKKRDACQLLLNLGFLFGIGLVFVAVVFKFESRSHINNAEENNCPFACTRDCYSSLPFATSCIYQQQCDVDCLAVGIQTAKMYATLFYVFVSVGLFLMVAQILYSCLGYFCLDYFKFKKTTQVPQHL